MSHFIKNLRLWRHKQPPFDVHYYQTFSTTLPQTEILAALGLLALTCGRGNGTRWTGHLVHSRSSSTTQHVFVNICICSSSKNTLADGSRASEMGCIQIKELNLREVKCLAQGHVIHQSLPQSSSAPLLSLYQ